MFLCCESPWNSCQHAGPDVVQDFHPSAPEREQDWLRLFVFLLRLLLPAARWCQRAHRQTRGMRRAGTPATEVSSWTDSSVCCFPHCWNSTPACLLVPMWLQSLPAPFFFFPYFSFLFFFFFFFYFFQNTPSDITLRSVLHTRSNDAGVYCQFCTYYNFMSALQPSPGE